jgi:hypothetical protein
MIQAPIRLLTLAAFLQQPETKPASEYIDGQVIQKPIKRLKPLTSEISGCRCQSLPVSDPSPSKICLPGWWIKFRFSPAIVYPLSSIPVSV